jgi:hypothetical protein
MFVARNWLKCQTLEPRTFKLLRPARANLPNHTASHPRRLCFETAPPREPQMSLLYPESNIKIDVPGLFGSSG